MICPYCKTEANWVENKEIYGRNYGKSYMCWLCPKCEAYVGCHNNTREPLGTLANKELREWRIKAHEVIDVYWKELDYTRKQVYDILREYYGCDIHVAEADIDMCKDLIMGIDSIMESWVDKC